MIYLGTFFFTSLVHITYIHGMTFSSVFLLIHSVHIQNTRTCQYIKKHLVTAGLGQNHLQLQYVNIYMNISLLGILLYSSSCLMCCDTITL